MVTHFTHNYGKCVCFIKQILFCWLIFFDKKIFIKFFVGLLNYSKKLKHTQEAYSYLKRCTLCASHSFADGIPIGEANWLNPANSYYII